MFSVVETQKGSKAIHFQENFYRLQKSNKNGSTRWICTNRTCSSSLTIKNEIILVARGIHNHSNLKRSIPIMKTVREIRQEVCDNVSKPIGQIYNDHVAKYVNTSLIVFFFIFFLHLFREK
jgi:hypothetical protein